MIYGCIFRCVDPCLVIAASMAFRSPFLSPFDKREEADKVKKDVSNGNMSDHLTLLTAYNGWVRTNYVPIINRFLLLSTILVLVDRFIGK
jgi:hypothetical protein